MKVTLLNLPGLRFRYVSSGILPPLGLAYVASALEKHNYEVEIIDLAASKINTRRLERMISKNNTLFYGLSSTLFGLREITWLAKFIKRCKPNSKVVLGGLCTFFSPEIILKRIPEIDVVVKGEGERTVVELCEVFECKKNLQSVTGIIFRENNQIISNPPRSWIDNLDENCFPARHLIPNNRYHLHPPYGLYFPITTIETSRGCMGNCNFCLYPSRPYRYRSANSVVDEIDSVVNNYSIREIYFADATFTVGEERTVQICDEIMRRGIKIAWTCKERVDKVSKKSLEKMKQAGCYMISFGVESCSQEILNNLNKKITVSQIEEAIRLTKEVGIRSIAYLMIGSPGENQESIQKTIKFINRLEPDFVLYAGLTPEPASMLYRKAIREGILSNEYYENLLFSNNMSEWPLYGTTSFSRKEIGKWVKEANKEFYLRPKYWFRRFINLKTIDEIKNIFKGLFLLLTDMIYLKRNVIG